MRKGLAPHDNFRGRFFGIFKQFGQKSGYKCPLRTILLINVASKPQPFIILTDHLWFNDTKEFSKLNLKSGDIVEFNARVTEYRKGYREDDEDNPFRYDYKLAFPRKIIKLSPESFENPMIAEYWKHKSEKIINENLEHYNEEVTKKLREYEENRKRMIEEWKKQHTLPETLKDPMKSPEPDEKTKKSIDDLHQLKITDFFPQANRINA